MLGPSHSATSAKLEGKKSGDDDGCDDVFRRRGQVLLRGLWENCIQAGRAEFFAIFANFCSLV